MSQAICIRWPPTSKPFSRNTAIESRPSRGELGIYIFLVDVRGHRDDPAVAQALGAVKEQADFFKVFGSYPEWADQ